MERHLHLKTLSTLRLGGTAKHWQELNNKEDVVNLAIKSRELNFPLFIVGGGSNTIFSDGEHQLLIGLMKIKGTEVEESETEVKIKVGAGENWDELVEMTVKNSWQGIEALSAIPGTVGAAPIQNIGAYGAEVSNVILNIEAYDVEQDKWVVLENKDCRFSYRDSLFKQSPGQFIITAVTLKLKKLAGPAPIPDYKGVQEYFKQNHIDSPSLTEIREAITNIRWSKLPKPEELPNNGSFFKNPEITQTEFETVLKSNPEIPHFPTADNLIKIPAGWLIEKAGLKGRRLGNIGTYDKNALVIVNHGDGTYEELGKFIAEIKTTVFNKFGLQLEPEVNIITN